MVEFLFLGLKKDFRRVQGCFKRKQDENGQSIKRVDFSLQHHLQHGHVVDSAEHKKFHRNILELCISLYIGSVEDRAEREKAIRGKEEEFHFYTGTNTAMLVPMLN